MGSRAVSSSAIVVIGFTLAGAACTGGGGDGGSIEPTYANVELTLTQSCAFNSTCHGGTAAGQARLNFAELIGAGEPLTGALNDVSSCEYDAMPRVDPGNPDNSWLMIKLMASHDDVGNIDFEPSPDWEHGLETDEDGRLPASTCPLTEGGALRFGVLMPRSTGAPTPLADDKIEMFRRWIELGAPGPTNLDP